MFAAFRPALLVAAPLGLCAAAAPSDACPRRLVTELPVADARRNPQVETRMDGTPVRMFLDTGAEHTVLTTGAVATLGLATDWMGFQPLWGIGGLSVHFNVRVERLEFGAVTVRDQSLAVGDFGPQWVARAQGLLGADILGRYDLDLDLGRDRVGLHAAVACNHPMPGWKSAFSRVGLLDLGPLRHLALVSVQLDGRSMIATIDTGAQSTTVTRRAAAQLGITAAALEDDAEAEMIGVGSQARRFRIHRFTQLAFGGETWRAPRLMVGDLPPFLGDMLLGADFLRSHRVWISWVNRAAFVAHDPVAGRRPGGTPDPARVDRAE